MGGPQAVLTPLSFSGEGSWAYDPAPERVRPTIRDRYGLFIGGEFVDPASGSWFESTNPATGEAIAQVAEAGAADVDRAVAAARDALPGWVSMPAKERGKLIYRLARRIQERARELAVLETMDGGKPIRESRDVDVPLAAAHFFYHAGWADKLGYAGYGPDPRPLGVAGQVIPWNFPLLMAAWKWGPALAAGNTVVMKPAEQTPLTCLRLGELAMEAGFPPGVINIVPGYGPTAGAAIVRHPDVDKVAFTGEYRTAQIIMSDAAETLKRLTFELGGKSPNVVFADADLDAAAAGAEFGLFFNQGQCCCAGSRLFVEKSVHGKLVDKIMERVKTRRVGDPFDPDTTHGPQVDRAQFDKILSYVQKGNDAGAKRLTGGGRVGDKGYFVEPTVFDQVTDDMEIARDEIFGPVMNILPFSDVDEVIDRANKTFYGLAAAVWTRDVKKAHRFAHSVRAGTVWVNKHGELDPGIPFAGAKQSGMGTELGREGLEEFTQRKVINVAR